MDPAEIEALTARAASGDREAVDALLNAYLPSLRAFVRARMGRVVRDHESSSDIAQSVCREVLLRADTFKHPSEGAFKRWLFRTALRKLSQRRDFLLAEKRDAFREVSVDDSSSDLLEVYGNFMTPSRGVAAKEEVERIEAALDELPEEQREVVVLARVVGMSRAEIAQELGRTEGSVRMMLHRALAQLAVVLARGRGD